MLNAHVPETLSGAKSKDNCIALLSQSGVGELPHLMVWSGIVWSMLSNRRGQCNTLEASKRGRGSAEVQTQS